MTYADYIKETTDNCMKVLSECNAIDTYGINRIKELLWADDRVTGVASGCCSSLKGSAEENIEGILFDEEFLADFNERGLDMQETMAYGPQAIDSVARCLALKHISIKELIEREQKRRIEKERQARNNPVRV